MEHPLATGLALATLILADIAWLCFASRRLFQPLVAAVQGSPLRLRPAPAVAAYVLMGAGLVLFVLPRSEEAGLAYAPLFGAAFGAMRTNILFASHPPASCSIVAFPT